MRTPVELAQAACGTAKIKSALSVPRMLMLGFLAGAYIAFAAWLTTVVTHDMPAHFGKGFTAFMAGSVFSVGLMMVVISGAELFTGNCMMPIGYLAGCTTFRKIARNWFWVYIANFMGGIVVAVLVVASGLVTDAVGGKALAMAAGKMTIPFVQAFVRGVLCNWLVTLAVWMTMASTDVTGKIWASFFPIMAFVASGFEHCVANMYFLTMGMLLRGNPVVLAASGLSEQALSAVGMGGYLANIVPVTLGNIVGGAFFVAVLYYFIYRDGLKDLQ